MGKDTAVILLPLPPRVWASLPGNNSEQGEKDVFVLTREYFTIQYSKNYRWIPVKSLAEATTRNVALQMGSQGEEVLDRVSTTNSPFREGPEDTRLLSQKGHGGSRCYPIPLPSSAPLEACHPAPPSGSILEGLNC